MNKKQTFALTAAGTYLVGLATAHYLHRRKQQKIDAEIDARLARDLEIVREASDRIHRRALTGYYDNKYSYDIENDFHFEIIAIKNGE